MISPTHLHPSWWEQADRGGASVPKGTFVHGYYRLPPGYQLCIVPSYAPIKLASGSINQSGVASSTAPPANGAAMLSTTYNAPKLVISLVQAIWGTITLYRARGNQIQEYGYAAFGLTVAPYAWMSIVNIIAGLSTPSYPALFMIRTPVMNEAEEAGGSFRLEISVDLGTCNRKRTSRGFTRGFMLSLVPLIIVGSLSKFANGNSSSLQRGFTMSWLVSGMYFGPGIGYLSMRGVLDLSRKGSVTRAMIAVTLLAGVAPLGGMIVVGMMLRDFGVCTRFT